MIEMKCPFCQQEVHITEWESANSEAYCSHCDTTGDLKLWQELIRTRKALEIALNCLNGVGKELPWVKRTLEEIAALEQKE